MSVLLGCSSVSTNTRQPGNGGGVLRIATAQIDNLNTVLSGGGASTYLSPLWAAYLFGEDTHGALLPELATDIPSYANGGVSRDGVTITYHLRKGVRWQDGAPFDARDVIFTWRAIMNPKNNVVTRLGYDKITAMTATNPYELHVRLREPYSPIVATLFAPSEVPFPILPAHLLASLPDINRAPYNAHPIGTGPFIIERWEPSAGVLLRANPHYWRGPPKLAAIDYRVVPDPNTIQVMLRTGELDMAYMTATRARELQGQPGLSLVHLPVNQSTFLSFNVRRPILDDVRVRHALAMAVDRKRYFDDFQYGIGAIADADQPPFLWSFDPNVHQAPYDLAAAARALDAAGWHLGAGGYRMKGGKPLALQIVYSSDQADAQRYTPLLQQALRQIGVRLDIRAYPYNILYAQASEGGILEGGKYDIAFTGWVGGIDPDDASLWMCDQIPPGGYNWSFLCDPRIDAQERIALTSYDQATRRRAYWRIQELLVEDQPAVFLTWTDFVFTIRSSLHNFSPTTLFSQPWAWELDNAPQR